MMKSCLFKNSTGYMLLILIWLVSCQDPKLLELPKDYARWSWNKELASQTSTFYVDSLLFKLGLGGQQIDTVSYLCREVFQRSYIDSVQNDTCVMVSQNYFKIEKPDSLAYHHSTQYCFNIHRCLEKSRFPSLVSVVYPYRTNKSWKVLPHQSLGDFMEYVSNEEIRTFRHWNNARYISHNDSIELLGKGYYNLIKIVYVDTENAIEKRFAVRYYELDGGLLYEEKWILDSQNIQSNEWPAKAERGYIVRKIRVD